MYGTDWLAFAHLVIAVAFWGPLRDPVRNIWVIEWGMIACVGIVPLALFAGPVRDIPLWWSATRHLVRGLRHHPVTRRAPDDQAPEQGRGC
jgi:hypothetical protein